MQRQTTPNAPLPRVVPSLNSWWYLASHTASPGIRLKNEFVDDGLSGCENGAGGCDCGCGCLPSSCRGRGRGRGPSCRGRGPADHRDCGSGCGCRIFGSGDRGRASTGRQRSGARRPWGCGSASGCGGCGSGTRPPLGSQASRHRHGRPAGGLRRAAGMEAGPWCRYSLPDLLSH